MSRRDDEECYNSEWIAQSRERKLMLYVKKRSANRDRNALQSALGFKNSNSVRERT